MANLCEYKINSNVDAVCDIIGGLKEFGYIANKADILDYTEANGTNTISAFTFDTDKVMYKIYTPTKTPFTGTNTALQDNDVMNRFSHTVSFVILDNDDTTVEFLNQLANGKFVVVVENEYNGVAGASQYSVYGIERGLRATEISRDPYDEGTSGGWTVTMVENGAAHAEHFFYVTDAATTKTTLDGYLGN